MLSLLLACLSAALLVLAVFQLMRMLRDVELEGRTWILSGIIAAAAVLAALSLAGGAGITSRVLAGITLVASALWGVLRLLAPQSKQAPAVAIGGPLPAFTAPDENGTPFDFSSLQGRPTLLKFFRGHW
jgi:cytochrome oxidase Cu insertion factor (SCO1/SenC/PrrC family)